ncbi:MAG: hypothetical protein K6G13_00880 [Agathobacter sp.]|uniref:ATP-binding protein n=1 Tax=Agathobacter sp. TaxID=2021311 RepID=UPI00258A7F51|nr:ATP-binding protein [Agathobacter sp.]MCR5676574.1 hypothetical protein [Agathobacter sp.]
MDFEEISRFSIEHSNDLILYFDETGSVFYENHAADAALEYGKDIKLTSVTEIFPSLFSWQSGQLVCMEPLDGREIETEAYRRNRTCFPVSTRIYQMDEDHCIVIACDMTERIQMRKRVLEVDQQIEDALKVKSEFTANVTHELRTPVNGISGNTRELLELETDPAKIRRLNLIERGCQDMHNIINNVLDFSKLEAGKFTLELREFVFRDMIDYAVSNHRTKINEKGLEFLLTISPDIPERIIGDELRIVQILNNLLSNAVKFTSAGKIILEVVKTAQIDSRIELFFLVIDSGIGIAKEDQDKLFQSFSQVDASISRKFGGTGLGLNITKQLVEMMGGSIHLESEQGKGSMFSFQIWVELPKDEIEETDKTISDNRENIKHATLDDFGIKDDLWHFGTEENLTELDKKMTKLVLCLEMGNWEKAESFADTIKQMTAQAPKEIKSIALRVKMAVQKEDYEHAMAYHKDLVELLKSQKAGIEE